MDVESEAAELLDVHRSTGSQIFVEVFYKGLPDNHILCSWLEWLQTRGASLSRVVVFSWIFGSVLDNPVNKLVSFEIGVLTSR